MDAFVTRKKRKASPEAVQPGDDGEDSTDLKLAMLSSLHPNLEQEALLDILLAHDGSVEDASASLRAPSPVKKPSGVMGTQASMRLFASGASAEDASLSPRKKAKLLSRKGATLHLFDPKDISEHTPCTVIHNFLSPEMANSLLMELMEEAKSFKKNVFQMFDNVVTSPHTYGLFVGGAADVYRQKCEYVYNGTGIKDVRTLTPNLEKVRPIVQDAVNDQIQERIKVRYPGGKKLKYQSPKPWRPNAAFVNCYRGPQESVGWHSDQLTYLGPRAVIGSLSLGVAREFRVRRVLPKEKDGTDGEEKGLAGEDGDIGDATGQIAIHLPHNSLLVMHADMQEEWKHSVAPARSIDPHPVAGNVRINVTYRDYREEFHPHFTPRCKCGIPTILRVVQKKKENWGRYFWMCYAGNAPGKESCSFFQWAEFDEDGNPIGESFKKRGTVLAKDEE